METNKSNPVIDAKLKVALTKGQITEFKQLLKGSGITYAAINYAGIHYNTFFDSALTGKPIKKSQADKLVEFFAEVKKAKAA